MNSKVFWLTLALLFLVERKSMELKAGVVLSLSPEMAKALHAIEREHLRVVGRHAIITSGRDGTHRPDSLHYSGNAVDIRSRDLSVEKKYLLASALKTALGIRFDVIVEHDHIHIEYDPK